MVRYKNAYTVNEENSHRFYQLPKELFVNEKYKTLNSDAKLLYALLLDRKELSRKNKWVDEYGQVYLLYTRDNLCEMLGVSRPTVTRAFKQLSSVGLIIEERQGLTKPNKIFVCKLEYGGKDSFSQEEKEFSTSDTDLSETEKKRYTISESESGGYLFSHYSDRFEEYFDKPHPTVTGKQLADLEYILADITSRLDLDEWEMLEIVDYHFDNLPDSNDGKIFAFMGRNSYESPIIRYAQALDE